ncbi:MAG: hypothetical protein BA861_07000 [Desulfobacterales bacterium S3730MH5]|nr:MAG: hypothetical protein BA861_07000 [Desulfobacterales bacterium S3730MH5]
MMDNLTLGTLAKMGAMNPAFANFARRALVNTYDDFIDVLYDDLDAIVSFLEENPELRHTDPEDRITVEIIGQLRRQGYDASHDTKHGGHADLLVNKSHFKWIGEAKIHDSYNYLLQGFQQLTTRYSSGSDYQQAGGLLIYHRGENTKGVMDEWAKRLASESLPGLEVTPCIKRSLPFFSSHTHEKSGLPFRVRHMPVMLYFNPKDKSARQRQGTGQGGS